MPKAFTTSIVVLTWNERTGLERMMPRIKRSWADEIVVVDNHSTDGTIAYCRQHGYRIVQQSRRGRGEAFRVGLRNTKSDIIVYFSPDGNEVPEDIPKLIRRMQQGYDMVIASRFTKRYRSDDAGIVRGSGNWFFTTLINALFGTHVTDAVNGFRAIRRKVMEDLRTDAQFFDIEIQMTMRCAKRGYRIAEIPTREPKRLGGEGRLNTIIDGTKYLRTVLREHLIGNR